MPNVATSANTKATPSKSKMLRMDTSPSHMTDRMPMKMMMVVPRSDCVSYKKAIGAISSTIICPISILPSSTPS